MDRSDEIFACPACGKPLIKSDRTYSCPGGHSFDIAAAGYVNLLLPNRMNSPSPGDDKNMVSSRAAFLEKGFYSPLLTSLQNLCIKYSGTNNKILDLGCGEGYYTHGILSALQNAKKYPHMAGIDISKSAAKLCSKRAKNAQIAVASVFHLPVCDAEMDMMINCFSPLCPQEIVRCLRRGGYFIYVVPGAHHLWEMKCTVYDDPYENEEKQTEYDGLCHVETVHARDMIHLKTKQDIYSLFTMTPYFWKTSQHDTERLFSKDELTTQIEFDIHIYKKEG